MRLRCTYYFSDEERRAIAFKLGESGKAGRRDTCTWVGDVIAVALDAARDEYDESTKVGVTDA